MTNWYLWERVFEAGNVSCLGEFKPTTSGSTLRRNCCHFDDIFLTHCNESCHIDRFRWSQWLKFDQNGVIDGTESCYFCGQWRNIDKNDDISVSVNDEWFVDWFTANRVNLMICNEVCINMVTHNAFKVSHRDQKLWINVLNPGANVT